ncbi:LysM peptidoglycan-binding domain-containing protein [Microbacterium sp.]|uniref:LysM peptidoglycan-binding domain-containing protein n=1 Tax=Microbacterium sp. TaxID=51671 RepID=UPI002FE1B870
MKTGMKIAIGVAALALVGIGALVTPALIETSTLASSDPTLFPSPASTTGSPDFSDGYVNLGHGTRIPDDGPGDCAAPSWIYIGSDDDGPMHAEMLGAELVDMGAREFATGTVGVDDQGRIATYVVAPGDTEAAIGERLCIVNGTALSDLNHYVAGDAIQPGDILNVIPNPNDEWPVPDSDGPS